MINFHQNLYSEEINFEETANIRPAHAFTGGDIKTSDEISGIEVRLSRAVVIDNKTKPFGPFPGLAKVYFMNIVLSDLSSSQIELNLTGLEKVDDNQTLAVDQTLFLWKKNKTTPSSPSQIHVMTSLIKSKQNLRNTGDILSKVQADANYKDLATELGALLKSASAVTNISNIVFKVAGIVGGFLGNVEDKPLLTRFQSFTDIAGDFNQLGKTTSPFSNKYAALDYTLFIRDKERQKEAEK